MLRVPCTCSKNLLEWYNAVPHGLPEANLCVCASDCQASPQLWELCLRTGLNIQIEMDSQGCRLVNGWWWPGFQMQAVLMQWEEGWVEWHRRCILNLLMVWNTRSWVTPLWMAGRQSQSWPCLPWQLHFSVAWQSDEVRWGDCCMGELPHCLNCKFIWDMHQENEVLSSCLRHQTKHKISLLEI